ncbi:MAG TPA: hypothetical protein VN673_05135, partial [Clostridia bacterium]|nr:hypothetical protein [Clostridia bacterium]
AAKKLFRSLGPFAGLQAFWRELMEHVPVGKETQFLRVLLDAPSIEIYDISNAVEEIHAKWLQRPAVKRHWPSFLRMLGRRFAEQIATEEYWNRFFGQIAGQHGAGPLQTGVFEGLAGSLDLIDATTFFGFVRNVSNHLTSTDAETVLDFALSRLEKHIPEDFGDGPWANWLNTADKTSEVLAGFMWAALGSPHSGIRWQAAHAVRRLAENQCEAEIGSLVSLLTTREPGPFVSPRLPFYYFHAKLYLLIALARIALDYPHLLKSHASVFANIALDGLPHVLIQGKAAEIALSISRAYPRLYSKPFQRRLKGVGISPFPIKNPKSAHQRFSAGKARNELRYHFALDFDRYWFQPLADVFGASNENVMTSADLVVAREFNVQLGQGYVADPRQQQWNNLEQRGSAGTYAHKGEYARIDRFDFYYSYHACMVVASELLSKTPVVRRYSYDEEDPWHYWLKWHSLSRRDGKWLTDRRDPSPVNRPDWVKQKTEEDWLWRVKADDFLNCLRDQSPLRDSIFVSGHWYECKDSLVENISISSALVNSETANALAAALRTAEDPNGFRLPDYLDEQAEIHQTPFELLGWIHEARGHHGIDRFDPYSKEIEYPPDVVAPSFTSMLGLFPDEELRTWHARGAAQPSLICEVWSEKTHNPHEEPFRHGQRNAASCKLLRKLCALTGKELIIEVRISRSKHRDRHNREEDIGYIPASHKIFTLSSNGVLKDRDKSYQLG